MADFGELFGGLLEGAGGAIQKQGAAEREHALRQLEQDHLSQLQEGRDRAQHGYRVDEEGVRAGNQQSNTRLTYGLMGDNQKADDERGAKNRIAEIDRQAAASRSNEKYRHDLDGGDYDSEITLDDGTVIVRNKSGATKALTTPDGKPVKKAVKEADDAGLTAGEQRAYNVFKADHTVEDATTGAKTVKTDAMYQDMKTSNPKLYAKLKGGGEGGSGGQSRKPPKDYPDAKWSEKAGGYVVQKNGKWFKVTE